VGAKGIEKNKEERHSKESYVKQNKKEEFGGGRGWL
jgi:hypothetical protein